MAAGATPRPPDQGGRGDHRQIATGHWLEEHIFELTQALELYRTYHAKIDECDRKIEAQLERFKDVTDGGTPAGNGRRRSQGNAPSFDIRTHLYRMTGVDLTRIDGIDGFTALKVVSEIGTDMTKWESAKHFASWLGLSPDNRITGGKVISSRTKPNANRAATALRLAAYGLHRSNSALGGLPAPEESTPGSAQGHHRHGAQAGETHLLHAALRAGLRRCRRRILREPVSATGVARCKTASVSTGLPTGAYVRCSGPYSGRTPQPGGGRLNNRVSRERR